MLEFLQDQSAHIDHLLPPHWNPYIDRTSITASSAKLYGKDCVYLTRGKNERGVPYTPPSHQIPNNSNVPYILTSRTSTSLGHIT